MQDAPGAVTFRTPAEAYDRHIGRYGPELARVLVAAAGVRPGARALDVGCGPGALTAELTAVLGAGHVAAVDPSPPFAAACRERHPDVLVDIATAEALPFEDAAIALDPAAHEHDEGRSMPFCTPDELAELWSGAGLADVRVSEVVVGADYDGFEDLWAPLERGVAPSGAYAVALAPERRSALEAEFRCRLGVDDQPFRLTARTWIATGRRP